MRSRREEYMLRADSSREKIVTLAARLIGDLDVLLTFDYSSTVMAILKRVADSGKTLELVVPESRCLDGGRPIVNGATAMGHTAVFIVDFAFTSFLRNADAVLFGAETLFANGDCWNTVGSYPIVSLASRSDIPCYVASELLKIDVTSFGGEPRPMRDHDFSKVLDYPGSFDHPDKVSVVGPDLDLVPASMISAYISDVGLLPPTQLWAIGERYLRERGVVQ
jgi:ribose 1,5-bisphosphate isomerase